MNTVSVYDIQFLTLTQWFGGNFQWCFTLTIRSFIMLDTARRDFDGCKNNVYILE